MVAFNSRAKDDYVNASRILLVDPAGSPQHPRSPHFHSPVLVAFRSIAVP